MTPSLEEQLYYFQTDLMKILAKFILAKFKHLQEEIKKNNGKKTNKKK